MKTRHRNKFTKKNKTVKKYKTGKKWTTAIAAAQKTLNKTGSVEAAKKSLENKHLLMLVNYLDQSVLVYKYNIYIKKI